MRRRYTFPSLLRSLENRMSAAENSCKLFGSRQFLSRSLSAAIPACAFYQCTRISRPYWIAWCHSAPKNCFPDTKQLSVKECKRNDKRNITASKTSQEHHSPFIYTTHLAGITLIILIKVLKHHETQSEIGDDQQTNSLRIRRRFLLLLRLNFLCNVKIHVAGSGCFNLAWRKWKKISIFQWR